LADDIGVLPKELLSRAFSLTNPGPEKKSRSRRAEPVLPNPYAAHQNDLGVGSAGINETGEEGPIHPVFYPKRLR
jgi:hypothetical protein